MEAAYQEALANDRRRRETEMIQRLLTGELNGGGTILPVRPMLAKKRKADAREPKGGKKRKTQVAPLKRRTPADLDPNTKVLAAFADTAYPRNKSAKQNALKKDLKGVPEALKDKVLSDYRLDESLTQKEGTVWVNDKDKIVITSYRGTKVKDLNDLFTDAALLIGAEAHTRHFKRSRAHFANVHDAYKDHKHILTGHSLGGATALHVYEDAKRAGIDIHQVQVFNPGASTTMARKGLKVARDKIFEKETDPMGNKKVFLHHIAGDPVSILSNTRQGEYKVETYEPLKGSGNPHSLNQFLQ